MAFNIADILKDVSSPDTGREQIEYIDRSLIDSDSNNFYSLSDLDGLAENIALCGLQQPIRVRRNPENPERFTIVSGHRRRAAIELLALEEPEKWREVSCIVESDSASPALQQLRLIYANANTRTLTPWETSQQAERVTDLLYRLKEEEGYEFPGRMRDHVSEAVGVSKSKLARLKVIRENLSSVWTSCFQKNLLSESAAYELARLPDKWQSVIYGQWGLHPGSLRADDVKTFKNRFERVLNIQCHHGLNACEHSVTMMEQNVKERHMPKCDKCCFECDSLQTCGKCCPQAKARKAELKDIARRANLEAAERETIRTQPYIDMARMVYERVGIARKQNAVTVQRLFEAQKRMYTESIDSKKQRELEKGVGSFSIDMDLPFGYGAHSSLLMTICRVADCLGCSIDYLLGRTEHMNHMLEVDTGSELTCQKTNPEEPGQYILILDQGYGSRQYEKWTWDGCLWKDCVGYHDSAIDGDIIGWIPVPKEV